MKIVVLDGYTLNPGDLSWDAFEALGDIKVYDRTAYGAAGRAEILARAQGAQALLVNKTPMDAETLRILAGAQDTQSLRYIGVLATGYNVVDVRAAVQYGVTVTNIPTYGTQAVAQYTMALLLELCHHAGEHSRSVHGGEWAESPDFSYWKYPLVELDGKTFGVIGYGRIGQTAAKLAAAFGMKVLAYDSTRREDGLAQMTDLDTLLRESDVVSLHCPLTPETTRLINNRTIGLMKRGAFLINTSRGPLVAESDLADALRDGHIAGAALDVVSSEPIAADNPLLQVKNCIITPHIAWAPRESRQRLMQIAADNLRAFLAGKPINTVGV